MTERREEAQRPPIFPMSSVIVDRVLSWESGAFINRVSIEGIESLILAADIASFLNPAREILAGSPNPILFSYLADTIHVQLLNAIQSGHIEKFSLPAVNHFMGVLLGAQLIRESADSSGVTIPQVREGDINSYKRERPNVPDFARIGAAPSVEVARQISERLSTHLNVAEPALGVVNDFFVRIFSEDTRDGFPYIKYMPFASGLNDVYFPVRKAHDRMRSKGR